MRIISISQLRSIHIILLSYPIIQFLTFGIIPSFLPIRKNAFATSIFLSSGAFLVGLLALVYDALVNFSNKKAKILIPTLYPNFAFKAVENKKISVYKKGLIAFSSVVGMSLPTIISVYTRNIIQRQSAMGTRATNMFYILVLIGFYFLFSKIFLHSQFFIHQYIAVAIIALGLIGLLIKTVILNEIVSFMLYYVIVCSIIPLLRVYLKIVMEKKYIQPITMTCYYGLFGLFFLSIVYLVVYHLAIANDYTVDILSIVSAFRSLRALGWQYIAFACADILLFGVYVCECCLINYYESPIFDTLLSSLVIIPEFIFLSFYETLPPLYFPFSIIGAVLLVIGVFTYVEIILIHFWQISYNTKDEIAKRAKVKIEFLNENSLLFDKKNLIEFSQSEL